MGILGKLKMTWRSMTTLEKVNLVLDVISGAGCGIGGVIVGNKLSEGRNGLEKICLKTAAAGLSLAACDVSSKALKENYGPLVAAAIDKTKEKIAEAKEKAAEEKRKAAEEKMKEAVANE